MFHLVFVFVVFVSSHHFLLGAFKLWCSPLVYVFAESPPLYYLLLDQARARFWSHKQVKLIKNIVPRRLQQVFFSYGLVLGVGVGCVLDTATLMVGQVGRSPSSSSSASSSPSPALMQSSSS